MTNILTWTRLFTNLDKYPTINPRSNAAGFFMPKRSASICTAPGCNALVSDGARRCSEHPSSSGWRSDKVRGTRQARGYGSAWQKIRMQILDRDSWLCQPCLKAGRLTQASQVDHIKPKAIGGTDDAENLQSICKVCHQAKTAREGG